MKRICGAVALAALASCAPAATEATRPAETPPAVGTVAPDKATFHLTITNQSFMESNAVLDVAIDGRRAVRAPFEVGGQHNFYGYPFALPPGEHVLTASGPNATSTEQRFTIPPSGLRYAVLQYWHYEEEGPRFTWTFQEQQPAFG